MILEMDLDDLVQEGSIGLLNAIPFFDAGRGMKFLTYAAPAIRNCHDGLHSRSPRSVLNNGWWIRKTALASERVYLDDVLSHDGTDAANRGHL